MPAGEPGDNPQSSQRDAEHAEQPGSPESSLLDLVSAIVVLIRQTWHDRWSLIKAETRLAMKSVLLLGFAILSVAIVLMLIWVLLLGGASYYAWRAGVHWGWIYAGLLFAQVLLLLYLRGQIRRLMRWMSFPEVRRAFAPLRSTTATETPASPPDSKPPSTREEQSP